ncbi:MAG: HDOD domain-containing protein [Leptospirales bacterium]|nr:HDOD domain-containing protein [Leptospirales bacterium]
MITIDNEHYVKKILNGEKALYTFRFLDDESIIFINSIILKILSVQGNIFLLETLTTIIREMLFNAFKSNLKRIYFKKCNADINDRAQYEILMKNFKDDFLYRLNSIEAEIKSDNDYYITISFEKKDDILTISVFNNVAIIKEEFDRITFRIQKSLLFNNLVEAYDDAYDSTEGAGLGLLLMVFLLKNSGIGVDNLFIKNNSDGITFGVKIPNKLNEETIISNVKEKILDDVDSIPTFPENIIQLQQLCLQKESSIDEISRKISTDPALTADVIKLSNSSGFVPGKKIVTVKEAVKIIGLKNLYFILSASATKKILENKYKKFEIIWQHCVKVAFYAKRIAEMKSLSNLADQALIVGLLHDIGKIVLLSAGEKIIDKMSQITKNNQLTSSSILEEISIGISHSEIGNLIAEKWNFPDELKIPITNHHSPLNSGNDHKELTYLVYLANMLCGVESKRYNYNYIEAAVLNRFKINSMHELEAFHENIKVNYSNHQQMLG